MVTVKFSADAGRTGYNGCSFVLKVESLAEAHTALTYWTREFARPGVLITLSIEA